MKISNSTTGKSQHQLNFVLDPEKIPKELLRNIGQGNEAWLFTFFHNDSNSIHILTSLIDEYFRSFQNISLNSHVYVITTDIHYSMYVFEVYRKMQGLELTIELLCLQNKLSHNIMHFNKNGIWIRRKNLTGVHLRIGYIPKQFYILEKNEVLRLLK